MFSSDPATRPPGEAQTYARLEAQCQSPHLSVCNGCCDCAIRCVDHIAFSFPEFARLAEYLGTLPAAQVAEVLGQDKRLYIEGFLAAELCPFLDRRTDLCLIYPVRPLICRLFGQVMWLPCPTGAVRECLPEGVTLMREYASLERHPLREWVRRTGARVPGLSE